MEEETLDLSTKSIADIKLDFSDSPVELTKKEKREILMREIYDFYKGEYDKRRKENWKRYVQFCKDNKLGKGQESQAKFKRSKRYIREISYESLKWLLKHIPTDDLHYFTSTGKEFTHTGRSFGGWLTNWFPKKI